MIYYYPNYRYEKGTSNVYCVESMRFTSLASLLNLYNLIIFKLIVNFCVPIIYSRIKTYRMICNNIGITGYCNM